MNILLFELFRSIPPPKKVGRTGQPPRAGNPAFAEPKVCVFSVWMFCCYMRALHELHNNSANFTKIIMSKMIWHSRRNISPSQRRYGNHNAFEWTHICCSVLILVPPQFKKRPTKTYLVLRILSFLAVHPTPPPQATFFPTTPSSGTSELLFFVVEMELAGAACVEWSGRRLPAGRKEFP